MRSSGDSRTIAFGLNRVWEPPIANSLPINSAANAEGPEGGLWATTYLADPDLPQLRPMLLCAPLDSKAAVASELNRPTWVPPAMTKLPISATAVGMSGINSDGPWWTYSGVKSNPEPQPHPPRPIGRLLGTSDALDSARPEIEAAVASEMGQQTWVPPAVTRLPLNATAGSSGIGYDYAGEQIPYRPDPEPQPRPPRPIDRLSGISDALHSEPAGGKAGVPSELDPRIWVPPAMITLPISATSCIIQMFGFERG